MQLIEILQSLSKMGSLRVGLLGFFIWTLLSQIQKAQGQECSIITSITSTSATSLLVQWSSYAGTTNYFLDLRVINSSVIPPVVVTLPAFTTQKEVFGLRPGTLYTVTLKVYLSYRFTCLDTKTARTVPDTSQITYSKALSSSSIALEWEKVALVDKYYLLVNSSLSGERYNLSLINTSVVVSNLRQATSYDCYIYTANAAGLGARSRVRTVTTLVQPPASVTVERTGSQTARVRWPPVDRVLLYRVTITDALGASLVNTTTSSTFLDMQSVLPCSVYLVSVSSINTFLEPGEPRQVNYSTNTLSPVTYITADYNCVDSSVTVSWGSVFGAESYHATAVSQTGTVLSCTATGTMCHLTRVSCGDNYMVQVSAIANNCENAGNTTTSFQTVSCTPTDLQLFRECSSNAIIFSWAPTDYAAFYMAQAVDSTGVTQECITADNSCFFTDTQCGRGYDFTVYSVSGQCNSALSSTVHIRTAPCQPTNMLTISDCHTDILMSKWDAAEGALRYVVEGFGNHEDKSYYSCGSVTDSCVIPGVACGESLTMKITAFDEECFSEVNLGLEANTVPCVPQNVSAVMNCGSESITLTWNLANGALFYMATATDALGNSYTCNSVGMQCQITGLQCGTMYTASVVSSNFKCNSSASDVVTVETAPCPPSYVTAMLDCDGNQAIVSWLGPRAVASFTATMEDQSGGLLSCSTTGSSCWVPSLKCGQVYDISVSYHDGICPSKPSAPIHIKSVPCGPLNVRAHVECGSGVLQMAWNQTDEAVGYVTNVVATGSGNQQFCNSTSPSCNLSSLSCGESYTVRVRSYNDTCFSFPSQPLTIKEAPCIPTNVVVKSSCGNGTVVTWQVSRGAQSYKVVAVSNGGYQTNCASNGTSCTLLDLHCGQTYNISVMAKDDSCTSFKSQSVTIQTVPCVPTNVHSVVQCSSNSVALSWEPSTNAVAYTGRAIGSDGHMVSCNSTSPGCQLTGLHCGQEYTFTVTASDGSCSSPDSQAYTQPTAPCAPLAVTSTVHCDINSVSVSWAPGPAALNYSAVVRPGNGSALSCTSNTSRCDIVGLQCGQNYTLVVTATNRVCTGPESSQQTIQTAPCMPISVHASVTCGSNTVTALWTQSPGALFYTSVLSGPNGATLSCSTSSLFCSFSSLTCAQNYTLHVVASDNQCNSTTSPDVIVTTGPCDPESVSADLLCDSGSMSVSWQSSAGASVYTVLAFAPNQTLPSSTCSTSSTSCILNQLQCGTVFAVKVLAGDSACNRSSRAATTIQTAPCPPRLQSLPPGCISSQVIVSWTAEQDSMGVSINALSVMGYTSACSSFNHSCVLPRLQCGQTYTVYGTATGLRCNSTQSAPLNIVTVPCTPATVHANYVCGTTVAELSWDDSLGRENFIARAVTQNHADFCSSNQTHCSISSLLCGHLYNVSVAAMAGQCNSTNMAMTQLQTAPCAPQNVSVSLQCGNNTAFVSWNGSAGAVGYNVTALGHDGDVKYCSTSKSSCLLANMHCAQTYDIFVTPFSDTCKGFQSSIFTFTAGPCPPTQVQVSLVCENNIGSVSWLPSHNAEMYVATASVINDHEHTCTTNGTGCSFLDLHCGNNYTVTVVTIERGCQSEPSAPVILKSAICSPANLVGHTNCESNDITITWDPRPQLGVTYFLFSQQQSGANSTFVTTQTSQKLTGLQCGWTFTVQVAAQDNTCTSHYSSPIQVHTAPCSPSGLVATTECGTNMGNLIWQGGVGTLFYTASLVSNEGHVVSCMSNTTSCGVKLECGHQYTATVVSSSGPCNSSTYSSVQFSSAPCLANNVQAQLDCDINSLAVQWAALSTSPESYTALAIGNNGTGSSCNTSSTSCTIQNLQCGHTYGIAVTASNIDCNVKGSDYQVQTAPCMAENPSISLECSTNIATVTWDTKGAVQSYRVSAVNFTNGAVECVSMGPSCTFNQFHCGETYTLTVTGVTQQCTSQPSPTMDLSTAPCIPTHVVASFDCDTSITFVTWDTSHGADSYRVDVVGSQGYETNCTSLDTSCTFTELPCGQDYSVTVVAVHGDCISIPSQPVTVSTGPCPYSDLQVSLDCSVNSVLISWMLGSGILSYNASAEALDMGDQLSCTTTGSKCNITQLQCAELYQVSVSGEGHTCPSPAQDWIAVSTAPCPPTGISVQTFCESDNATVSWEASQGSLFYQAVAQGRRGHQAMCSTNGTMCDIIGLQCGQTYDIHVSGVDENCVGPKSMVQTIQTAPCVPQNVQAVLECQSPVLNITWQQTGDATNYFATVESSDGQMITCGTDKLFCSIPDIRCGLTYSAVVFAQNKMCNSTQSSFQQVTAAPCPPSSIMADMNCESNTISVNWPSVDPGVRYVAEAVSSTANYTCTSTNTSCSIDVPCGMTFTVNVVPILGGCAGAHSDGVTLQSAPCVPTLTNVEMDCLSNSAWVVWYESAGAEFYTVTATDGDVQQSECNSTDSTCAVADLRCGKHYNFSLTASNRQCSSALSNTMESESAPCAPENVVASVGCVSGTVSVGWDLSVDALSYTATLEHTDGATSCCTTDRTSCEISSLPCGQMYVVTITAKGRTCNSSQSTGAIARTAPCTPLSLTSNVSCDTNVVTMSWEPSAGGQVYIVHAVSDNHMLSDTCTGFDSSCDLSGLVCGLPYIATVVAQDSTCASPPSSPARIRTVPCTPTDVIMEVDCQALNLSVMWEESAGADFYTATLLDSWGRSTNCQSRANNCSIGSLSCGDIYHVSVIASDAYCRSQPSAIVDADSVPCAPRDIQALVDCQSGTVIVSWQPGASALDYTATAVSNSGHAVSCETNETSCELLHLVCASSYSITVQAQGYTCTSSASMSRYLETGPCVPENIRISYSPPLGQVSWDMTKGAVNYSTLAQSQEGQQASCASQDTSCVVYGLTCSQTYTITITADNSVCHGTSMSSPVMLDTEPCPPSNVQAQTVCSRSEAVVTWEVSDGAVSYLVILEGRTGDTLSCQTTETYCSMSGLQCGTVYTVYAQAIGVNYNSSYSFPVLLTSEPCMLDLSTINVAVQCENDTALVSWDFSEGASSIEVNATSNEGHVASCASKESNCYLTQLMCGETYNLTLQVINSVCQLSKQIALTFQTRPCIPQYVDINLICGSDTAVLTWDQKSDVAYYLASATSGAGGAAKVCNSRTNVCQFRGLECGAEYTFTVKAYNGLCYSDFSSSINVTTDPCQPQHLNVAGSCDSNTFTLTWDHAPGALDYNVVAAGNLGYSVSYQTKDSRLAAELPCGQSFSFTVVGQDERCESPTSSPVQYTTAPCVPLNVETYIQCEESLAAVSWASSDGAEVYTAVASNPLGHTYTCMTNDTACTWNDLQCGETYTISVIASNIHCSSAPSNSSTVHMDPCVPQDVVSTMDCDLRVATLTWSPSLAAQTYLVMAECNSGHRVSLSTNDTSAQISELQCGQQYYLSVAAIGQGCSSKPSNASVLQTEPCPPTFVSTSVDCFSNIVVVTWSLTDNADHYTARALGSDGLAVTCMSLSTDCGIASLPCGETYNVTVTAASFLCNSVPSHVTVLKTAPCVPMDISVEMDCKRNEANVSWSASKGAVYYQAFAQSRMDDMSVCNSTGNDTYCTVGSLTCGMPYTAQVVAVGEQCSSLPSQASEFHTAPCSPTIDSVQLNCSTNSLLLDWITSGSAVSYTATATAPGGRVSTCVTNMTSCELTNLWCGQTYNVTVAASDGQCGGEQSASVQAATVPCRPVDILAWMNCSTNTAHIEWDGSSGAEFYQVSAVGAEGHTFECNTTHPYCDVPHVPCGDVYQISVVAVSNRCSVMEIVQTQLHSVPCVPVPAEISLDCVSGDVTMVWEPSLGANSYMAEAWGSAGFASSCNSSGVMCVFSDMLCGMIYSLSVSASDGTCSSAYSDSIEMNTVPCEPHAVSAHMDCQRSAGVVSWEQESGVVFYTVQADSDAGDQIECNSTGTSCSLANVRCGQEYSLAVTAHDTQCNGSTAHLYLQSVPCVPTDVQALLNCSSDSATVSWQRASGALAYHAEAVSEGGLDRISCNSSLTYCDLGEFYCGTSYSVTVEALDHSCGSRRSAAAHVRTAPCPPQDVTVKMSCLAGSMTVSWAANPDADSYLVEAVPDKGSDVLTCSAAGTNCTIASLPCGVLYTVTVRAERGDCVSRSSTPVQTHTVPCVPQGETGSLDCVTNSVWVSWQQASGAVSYRVMATAVSGHNSSCSTSGSYCNVPNLLCGAQYAFHVTALNAKCSSPHSGTFQVETAPCALTGVSVTSDCYSSAIRVSWHTEASSSFYVATAEGHDLSFLECNGTGTSCTLMGARCGMQYTIMVSATSDKCNSLRSPPYVFNTAPCAPAGVTVKPLCEAHGVLVSWTHSPTAQSYSLTATGGDGDVRTCSGPADNCTLPQLHCGQPYAVTVTASTPNCTSPGSQGLTFQTVPCGPQAVSVYTHCDTASATVSWSPVTGATGYFASAYTPPGELLYCDATGTSCSIKGLQCGAQYNFSVSATDGTCNSSFGQPVQKGAVPCPPASVSVRTHATETAALIQVTWSLVACPGVQYLAELSGRIGDDPLTQVQVSSYWTERRYFEFLVPCDTPYSVTVKARNQAGDGQPSSAVLGAGVHCTTSNVNNSGQASGRRKRDLRGAEILAGLKEHDMLSVPEITVAQVTGTSLYVEWAPVTGASYYTLIVREDVSSRPLKEVLTVYVEVAKVTDLKPATRYCVVLSAKNSITQSEYSLPVCVTTETHS